MNAIKCEICGSSELTKKEGVFVCDYCGTKYSLEEVKKMMVEGTVEVTGTVKIDTSEKNKGKIQLAFDAYVDMDYERADALADEVIQNDSALSDAWYIKALINKDSNYVLYERYKARGDENSSNSLGIVTTEKFEELKFTDRDELVTMGFINNSKSRFLTILVDDKAVHTRAKQGAAVQIKVPKGNHVLKVLDTETGIMITEDKFYLVEGRVLTTSRKTERYFKPVKCIR